jgi:hypothetical protein
MHQLAPSTAVRHAEDVGQTRGEVAEGRQQWHPVPSWQQTHILAAEIKEPVLAADESVGTQG